MGWARSGPAWWPSSMTPRDELGRVPEREARRVRWVDDLGGDHNDGGAAPPVESRWSESRTWTYESADPDEPSSLRWSTPSRPDDERTGFCASVGRGCLSRHGTENVDRSVIQG